MPRYAPGTVLDYTPFDRDAVLVRVLGRLAAPPSDEIRLLARDLVRGCRTEDGVKSYAQELVAYLRWCAREGLGPLALDEDDALAYAASIDRYAQGTQNIKLLTVRLLYRRAIRRGLAMANPFEDLRLPAREPQTDTPALTRSDVEAMLSAIATDFGDPEIGLSAKRDYALVLALVRLCLRASEACALRWGRFSTHNGRTRIAFVGKGRKPAHLDLPGDLWQTLQAWKRAYERATGAALGPSDPVFLPLSPKPLVEARSRRGASPLRPIDRHSTYLMIHSRLLDLGKNGDRYGPHCLRATGATLAWEAGATIIEIQELLRHTSVNTTMRYLQKLVGGAATAAIDKVHLDVPVWDEADAEVDDVGRGAA